MIQIKNLLRAPKRPVLAILQEVPLEQLDEAVAFLERHKPAPLVEFETLRDVYRKHCADRA